jgi:4-hydroxybenzoate polyprenyltransferase
MARYAPLTSGFMLTSIIGFLVSVFFVVKIDLTWGLTFALFFVIAFIASVVSMSKIEADDKYGLQELAVHEKRKPKKGSKK